MWEKHNVNDNGIVSTLKPNDNYNDNVSKSYSRGNEIDMIVNKLQLALNAKDESRPFLCKAAWKLSEAMLWSNCEAALKGKNPMGLFIWLCKKAGV